MTDYLDKIEAKIVEQGHVVQGVFDPAGSEPAFAYTIGNIHRQLPELFLSGLSPQMMQLILNDACEHLQNGVFQLENHGKTNSLLKGYDVVFRRVEPELVDTELNVLRAYCHRKALPLPEVYQLVWPDAQHRFPWDAACDSATRDVQRVLYRAVH